MIDPNPVNFMTPEEVRSNGWQAESRDADGHLIGLHAPFGDDAEGIVWFVREATSRGETVTIWPLANTEGQP
jgi:molybdopterin synthase sulfur carrier subunit